MVDVERHFDTMTKPSAPSPNRVAMIFSYPGLSQPMFFVCIGLVRGWRIPSVEPLFP